MFSSHALTSRLRDVYIKRSVPKTLSKKIIYPIIFDTNCSFKRQNALLLTKGLFIKIFMARCSRKIIFSSRKSLCFIAMRRQVACEMFTLKEAF